MSVIEETQKPKKRTQRKVEKQMGSLSANEKLNTLAMPAMNVKTTGIELTEEYLARKFSRPAEEKITFEVTQDRALLHQYYDIRERMYRKMFDSKDFVDEEDLYDKLGHIIVARRGKLCLGGCRLIIREGDEGFLLPLESQEFKLRNVFPDLPLSKERHGEISRFAILDDYNNRDVLSGLCEVMYNQVVASGAHYMFAKSTLTMARHWRLIANSFGVKTTQICDDLKVPEHSINPDIKWYITLSDLTSLYGPADKARKASYRSSFELSN